MNSYGYLTLFGSMLLAVLLMIMPLSSGLATVWPLWIVVVLGYWLYALPHRVSLGSAVFFGLLLDVFNNTLLGQHALALVTVAYIMEKMHHQMRLFFWWQQSLFMMFLTAIYVFILYIVQSFLFEIHLSWHYWLPIFTTGLVWPLVFGVLRHYRQKFRMI